MSRIFLPCLLIFETGYSQSGFRVKYNPSIQHVTEMQYFKPSGELFVGDTSITAVSGLNHSINVDIIMKHDIIDVNVDNRRCIVNRLPEQKGNMLWLFAKHGSVCFKSIRVSPLSEN